MEVKQNSTTTTTTTTSAKTTPSLPTKSDAFVSLFGDTLLSGTKKVKTEDHLQGKTHVMIYFSAHWCPPCRGFTPDFVEWYNKFMKTEKGKMTEVVFKSWDKTESAFTDYFATMPWTAIPYGEQEDLGDKFGVEGIPTVVVLDQNGEVVTKKGRKGIMNDETGENFPWPLGPPLVELFGDTLLIGTETVNTEEHLKGKTHVMIYFSAHWCPPCRGFTPDFVKWYNKFMKTDKGKKTEVVFRSWDKTEEAFTDYFATMPWAAIPFRQPRELGPKFGVRGIPTVVVLDQNGDVVTKKGRAGIMSDSTGENFPWPPEPTEEVNGDINQSPSLVVVYKDSDDLKANKEKYNEIAKEFKKCEKKLLFFHITKDNVEMHEQLVKIFKIKDDTQMVIADIPNGQSFCYKKAKDNSGESIKAFVTAYLDDDNDALDQKSFR